MPSWSGLFVRPLVVLALIACAPRPREVAAQIAGRPEVRNLPDHAPRCNAMTLARFEPGAGRVGSRRVYEQERAVARTVAEEEVACGPTVPCLDFAKEHASQTARAAGGNRVFRTWPDSRELGTDVTLRVDGARRPPQLYPHQAALLLDIRALEARGRSVQVIVSESRHIEFDWSRIRIRYSEREASSQEVPEAEIAWEVPPGPRAFWESLRVLEDELGRADVVLDDESYVRLARLSEDILGPAIDGRLFPATSGWKEFIRHVALGRLIPPSNAPAASADAAHVRLILSCR